MNRIRIVILSLGCTSMSALAGVIPPTPYIPAAAIKQLPKADAPKADEQPGESEEPAKIAERITQNSKTVSDKLSEQDTGDQTRKTQDQILKDIDRLLKQSQNPPPMSGGGQDNQNKDQSNQNKGGGSPMGGGMSMGGGNPKGGGSPMGGSSGGMKNPAGGMGQGAGQQKGSWRDRRNQDQPENSEPKKSGDGSDKKDKPGTESGKPMGQSAQPNNDGMGKKEQNAGGKDPMNPGGSQGGMGGKSTPSLPLDDAITKQVWGHLPERLRQQMSQYYREQFMPKYSDMLRQYYSSLAEREKAPKKP